MMLGMAHMLITEQRHDHGFLVRCCTGFDAFERYLLGATDGVAKTPEWAAAICGVPAETIRTPSQFKRRWKPFLTCK